MTEYSNDIKNEFENTISDIKTELGNIKQELEKIAYNALELAKDIFKDINRNDTTYLIELIITIIKNKGELMLSEDIENIKITIQNYEYIKSISEYHLEKNK